MKTFTLVCLILVTTLAAVHATSQRADLSIVRLPTKAVCFTNTPDKYPALAASSAPVVTLNPAADAVQLYSQFQMLTRGERIKFFTALSASSKSKVWLIHLSNFSISHDLTPDQQAYIDDVITLLKSSDFHSLRGRINAKWHQARTIALFGNELAWELTVHLGGRYPFADNKQSVNYTLPGVANFNIEPCDCFSDGSNYGCSTNYICLSNGQTYPCIESSWGCGWLWFDNCNGKCRWNIW